MSNDHPRVLIASRPEAGELLQSDKTGPAIRHLVSIADPGEPPPAGYDDVASKIRLIFYDIDADTDFEQGPAREDVEAVIAFARRIAGEFGDVLVQCSAGISRSSAAALTMLATWLGAGHEEEAVLAMYEANPLAQPNTQFVLLADDLLERDGALLRAMVRARLAIEDME